jgi:hypothetical protein
VTRHEIEKTHHRIDGIGPLSFTPSLGATDSIQAMHPSM